jgi:hypothetical protein
MSNKKRDQLTGYDSLRFFVAVLSVVILGLIGDVLGQSFQNGVFLADLAPLREISGPVRDANGDKNNFTQRRQAHKGILLV